MPVTKKITIVLPKSVGNALEHWAEDEGRPLANLAAYLLEQATRIKYPGEFPPPIQEKKK
jgi:hypothetical protein